MIDAILIKFDGQERVFHFNNFALVELSKLLQVDASKATESLMELMTDNYLSAMSAMIFCGFVGYEKSQFNLKHGLTIQYISNWVANATGEEMNEFTPAWESFKKSTGISEFLKEQSDLQSQKEALLTPEEKAKSAQKKKK